MHVFACACACACAGAGAGAGVHVRAVSRYFLLKKEKKMSTSGGIYFKNTLMILPTDAIGMPPGELLQKCTFDCASNALVWLQEH